jgi:single-strand DNA-binding protein
MLNQTVLVGRLTKNPEVLNKDGGKKISTIILAVQRSYKNADGLYDTDFIKCILWNGIAENTAEYCHSGDVVGIKGRLQSDSYQDSEGNTKYVTEVIAEKVTFLTSKKEETK